MDPLELLTQIAAKGGQVPLAVIVAVIVQLAREKRNGGHDPDHIAREEFESRMSAEHAKVVRLYEDNEVHHAALTGAQAKLDDAVERLKVIEARHGDDREWKGAISEALRQISERLKEMREDR